MSREKTKKVIAKIKRETKEMSEIHNLCQTEQHISEETRSDRIQQSQERQHARQKISKPHVLKEISLDILPEA